MGVICFRKSSLLFQKFLVQYVKVYLFKFQIPVVVKFKVGFTTGPEHFYILPYFIVISEPSKEGSKQGIDI